MTGAPVDVIFGQAALSSHNPQINQSLGNIGLFHTATVFKQGDKYWTLEFDLTSADQANSFLWLLSFLDGRRQHIVVQ